MQSRIETLPGELYNMIIGYLDATTLSRLLQCNKVQRERIEPKLYATDAARRCAMRWACEQDNPIVIQRAVKYGADVSYLYPEKRNESYGRAQPTISIAITHCSLEAVKCLISLGVQIECLGYEHAHDLLWKLRSPKRWDICQRFVDAGLGSTFLMLREHCLTPTLVEKIVSNGPNAVQDATWLIDHGACVNAIASVYFLGSERRRYASPLSAAILADSRPLFDLLLARGADIHSSLHNIVESAEALHIPIFAACYAASSHASLKWVETCLDAGADINTGAHLRMRLPTDMPGQCNYLQLVAAYLVMDHSWDENAVCSVKDVATYLFDRGATIRPAEPPPRRPSSAMYAEMYSPCLAQMMIGKWTPAILRNRMFFDVITRLVELGDARNHVEDLFSLRNEALGRSFHCWRLPDNPTLRLRIVNAWKAFLDLILDDYFENASAVQRPMSCTELLFSTVYQMGTQPQQRDHIIYVTAEHLVSRGGNLNDDGSEAPILHQLCLLVNRRYTHQLPSQRVNQHAADEKSYCAAIEDLVDFLLSLGADPMIDARGKGFDRVRRGTVTAVDSVGEGFSRPEVTAVNLLLEDIEIGDPDTMLLVRLAGLCDVAARRQAE
ncbi:hypothetical protein EJ05DRAFT_33999 [Pseudovirgaria hyperparasitica]|uniref:Ankyrin n=1 Tax=Pseudovirgaria hyperparasitica TaxID=470096 RepID=A0A6A6WMD8_9PEZI|nr:uncharacterized protein EJ05DRAFT_33999 [Pseudovirgaria hyperparasitica]KAF2763318.1 hypothetical protein EJ05DRAFT_33999 [Pseudovirgaria hyperparasitica]